ncbi:hypothetical protein C0J52_05809 [Blattella germanica]|nr:hypothetical protein C0J52_05809 [Blattella germanica]
MSLERGAKRCRWWLRLVKCIAPAEELQICRPCVGCGPLLLLLPPAYYSMPATPPQPAPCRLR